MTGKTKGLHEELHDLQNEIYHEAEAITSLDEKTYYTDEDRKACREHAKRILALLDQHEKLDAGAAS